MRNILLLITLAILTMVICSACNKQAPSQNTPDNSAANTPPSNLSIDSLGGAPPHQAVNWTTTPILKWRCTDSDGDQLVFDVFFGRDSLPAKISSAQTDLFYLPDTLEYSHTYYWQVVADDSNLHTVSSSVWSFTTALSPDTIYPTATITSPIDGVTVSDTIIIEASVEDDNGIVSVEFYIDSILYYTDDSYPWECPWNTSVYPDRTEHTIRVVAYDAVGNMGSSSTTVVTVLAINHNPNTHFRCSAIYINAHDENSSFPGVTMQWSGADSADWGRIQPPLEFEWRLYGPFDDTTTIPIYYVQENWQVPVLDINSIPVSLNGIPQPHSHSKGDNYDVNAMDVWTQDYQTDIYDIFDGLNLVETSRFKFVFWVRARDDQQLPDTTPAFSEFLVIEPLFERSVAIFDETRYSRTSFIHPVDMDSIKAMFYNYIQGAGYSDFDTISGVDYFHASNMKNETTNLDPVMPELMDILSHKVIISYNDQAYGNSATMINDVIGGLDWGSSAWVLSRNIGAANVHTTSGTIRNTLWKYKKYFGVSQVICEGWTYEIFEDNDNPVFNEEFVGAAPNSNEFPELEIIPELLNARYANAPFDSTHILVGLPEVGYIYEYESATPIYQFVSKDTTESPYHGMPVAVTKEKEGVRTACFLFTPLALDPANAQIMFDVMLEWLTETAGPK